MEPIEIIVITSAILVVLAVLASYIYKKAKGIPTGECETCQNKKRTKKMFDNIRKELDEEKNVCLNCNSK